MILAIRTLCYFPQTIKKNKRVSPHNVVLCRPLCSEHVASASCSLYFTQQVAAVIKNNIRLGIRIVYRQDVKLQWSHSLWF